MSAFTIANVRSGTGISIGMWNARREAVRSQPSTSRRANPSAYPTSDDVAEDGHRAAEKPDDTARQRPRDASSQCAQRTTLDRALAPLRGRGR